MNFIIHLLVSILIYVVVVFTGDYLDKKKTGKPSTQESEKPTLRLAWTLIILFNVGFFYFNNLYNQPKSESYEVVDSADTTTTPDSFPRVSDIEFILEVKENQNIIEAGITDMRFLYISVVNDGTDKTPMARSYCIRAQQRGVNIKAVKIVDAADAQFEPGAAYGSELAKSFCN